MVQLDLFEIVCDTHEPTHHDSTVLEWLRSDRDSIRAYWSNVEWELKYGRFL